MTEKTNLKTATTGISGSDDAIRPFLAAVTPEQAADFIAGIGESAYRAKQLYDWVARKWVTDPDRMSNLPASLREKIRTHFLCAALAVERDDVCADGSRKLLLSLFDGETVECALIPAEDGRMTFCLSTQVGCPVRCAFCSSGADGFTRNLDAGEIVEQFFAACRQIGSLPDNVVIMGIGEPLLNLDNLIAALERICDPDRVALAARRVTISTSGWTPGIKQLALHGRQWNLAVSLHAPDDKTRALLIPTRFRRDIRDILQACKMHREATHRLLTFEYVLLDSINDSVEQAVKLAKLAREADAKINLIPYNKAKGAFTRPSKETIKRFENALKAARAKVTIRVEKGADSSAACGQLRATVIKEKQSCTE